MPLMTSPFFPPSPPLFPNRLVLYLVMALPLEIFMEWDEKWHKPLGTAFEVLFWMDMVFSFFTGFIEENGEIRMSPRAIAIHYLR